VTDSSQKRELTAWLTRWRDGVPGAADRLMELVYPELRKLARSHMRRERPGHTWQPTELVDMVYIKLLEQTRVEWTNRQHFFGIAARLMRRLLVDHARGRRSRKRDAGVQGPVSIPDIAAPKPAVTVVDVIDLDDALNELEKLDARQVAIVEQRYFSGLTNEEIADAMNLSTATVKREWTTAKLWLQRRLKSGAS
jgi:RNA polymerase sigma factor (TIGR02999 family)